MHSPLQLAIVLLVSVAIVSSNAQSCSSNSDCTGSLQCCATQCYDTGKASCNINRLGNEVLCGFQHLPATTPDAVCGTICYDTFDYGCCNSTDTIYQLSNGQANCPVVAPTPTPNENACDNCADGLSCCDSMCYDPSTASCVTSSNGNSVLCGFQHLPLTTPDAACGSTCYDTDGYSCCAATEQIYMTSRPQDCQGATSAPTTAAPTTAAATTAAPTTAAATTAAPNTCDGVTCGDGLNCCAGQCYSTGQASCVTSNTGATVLCGFQHLPDTTPDAACGTTCYDTLTYGCCNSSSVIYGLDSNTNCANTVNLLSCGGSQCMSGFGCCAESCYDSSAFSCVSNSNNQQMICNNGDQACGLYCFSGSSSMCCNNIVYALNDASIPASCGGVANQGNFFGNNGYNGYNGNGGYYYDNNGVFRDCSQNGASSLSISFAAVVLSVIIMMV